MIDSIRKSHPSSVFSRIGIVLFLLGLWGCLAVFNAMSDAESPFYFSGRQFLWLLASIFFFWCSAKIGFDIYFSSAPFLGILSYIPLLAVLLFGTEVNGMKGWFDLGLFFVQPSEMAKPFFILLLVYLCKKRKGRERTVSMILLFLGWTLPIALEPDWGTLTIYFAAFLFVFLLSGAKISEILVLIVSLAVLGGIFMIKEPYVIKRISGFLAPSADPSGAGWHILQFKYAIARGGIAGEGLGKSVWSNSYLPLPHSDSSFSSVAESVGVIGSFPVIAGFIFFLLICFTLSFKELPDERKLFIATMSACISFQAFLHISVNLGILPPTGVTLPLISYGGSSMLSTMIAAGMIVSASATKGGGRIGQWKSLET